MFTLTCNPAGGTVPDPATACRKLQALGAAAFAPTPRGRVCTQIAGGPMTALVTGSFLGHRIWTRLTPARRLRDRALESRLVPAAAVEERQADRQLSRTSVASPGVKTVLFVGAGRHQRRAIMQARDQGIRVVAVDRNPDALGFQVADVAEAVDFTDIDAVTEVARRHARRRRADRLRRQRRPRRRGGDRAPRAARRSARAWPSGCATRS